MFEGVIVCVNGGLGGELGTGVPVGVLVTNGVFVGVTVENGVPVAICVLVGVKKGALVGVTLAFGVGVLVGVKVFVGVGVSGKQAYTDVQAVHAEYEVVSELYIETTTAPEV